MTIALATFNSVTDKLAGAAKAFSNGAGTVTPGATTAAYKVDEAVTTIRDMGEINAEIALEAGVLASYYDTVYPTCAVTAFSDVILALRNHITSFSTYCSTNATRVAPEFAQIANKIQSGMVPTTCIFCDTVDPVATFTLTAANAGTLAINTAVPTTSYSGSANMGVKVGAVTIVGQTVLTITMLKFDGAITANQVVTVAAGATPNVCYSIGTPGTHMYQSVSTIAVSGGATADVVYIYAKRERALT